MRREKILIVEDEPDILEVLEYNLTREGYRVSTARDGTEGLLKARESAPDLVLLDLMLPGTDGLEVCRKLRADSVTSSTCIIMVTAKSDESDLILGLGIGADDYITKPFSPKEVLARVRAVLRRGRLREDEGSGDRMVRGALVIDTVRHEVLVAGEPCTLTPTEFRLLRCLASHPGRVFSREQLLSRVIKEDAVVLARNIDVHVRSLRQKLARNRDMVETVRGVGYRFREG